MARMEGEGEGAFTSVVWGSPFFISPSLHLQQIQSSVTSECGMDDSRMTELEIYNNARCIEVWSEVIKGKVLLGWFEGKESEN